MSRKIIALVLASFMLLGLLGGCSGKENTTKATTNATTKAATTQATTTAAPPVKPTYHYVVAPAMSAPIDADSDMEQYWEEKFGVTFDLIYMEAAEFYELLNLRISSGDVPDAFKISDIKNLTKYYNEEVLGGFTPEYLKDAAPLLHADIEATFGEKGFNITKMSDGLMYSLPYTVTLFQAPVIWNMDWLKAVGKEIPKTIAEFEDVFYSFRNDDPDGNGVKDTYGLSKDGMQVVYGAYGYMGQHWQENDAGELRYDMTNDHAKEALALLAKWYKDGVLDPEFITGENKGGYWPISHSFVEGRIGMTCRGYTYHWKTKEFVEKFGAKPSASAELIFNSDNPINFDYGYPAVGPYGAGTSRDSNLQMLAGFSKKLVEDTERFNYFLNMIETTAGLNDVNDYIIERNGIEGKHWDYDAQKKIQMKDAYSTVEGLSAIGANTTFLWYMSAKIQNELTDEDGKYIANIFLNDPDRSPSYMTKLLVDLPSNPDYFEECRKVLTESATAIITGQADIDSYDTAIAQYYKIGGDKLTEEANAWYATQK